MADGDAVNLGSSVCTSLVLGESSSLGGPSSSLTLAVAVEQENHFNKSET